MVGLTIWIAVGVVSVAGIETPKYEVIAKHDGYEVRQYAPQIVAEVTMGGEFREAMNGGFRKLADYIFGNNTKVIDGPASGSEKIEMTAPVLEQEVSSEKIKMTAPVLEQQSKTDTRVVSFVMPSKYTLDTLPKPNNADVRVVEVPAKRYAVNRFSGTATQDKAAKKKQDLLDALKRDKIEAVGAPLLAQYNPPWTPPLMRRNEVMVEIATERAGNAATGQSSE
ncbi:MAG: heme-binding protein [Candidatus Hydrogenedentes bacterium]|nr:heme-binding protein [Candidatus Hydrogenedentota bacterium]